MLRVTHFDLFNVQTWGVLFPLFAWIGSVFTFIYSMKLLFKTFRGNYQPEQLEKAGSRGACRHARTTSHSCRFGCQSLLFPEYIVVQPDRACDELNLSDTACRP